jgi:hypothetical protein
MAALLTPKGWRHLLLGWMAAAVWSLPGVAWAHASSNSYLHFGLREGVPTLRVDVPLRDVDLWLELDTDRSGDVTWAEVSAREAELLAWVQLGLRVDAGSVACTLTAGDMLAAEHAEGFHLSTEWLVACPTPPQQVDAPWVLRYGLLFDRDNLHRGLLRVDVAGGEGAARSAILSPERPSAELTLTHPSAWATLAHYVVEGVWHIWIGFDHILFLLSLLVLAPLVPARARVSQWAAVGRFRTALLEVLAVVTAFTVAHSITLSLAVLQWVELPAGVVEPVIALSVVLAALNNLWGWGGVRRWRLAFGFGLIHGFGFASVLVDLGLPAQALALALGGFNVGVELGQLAIVAVFLPLAWWLRHTAFYRWGVVVGGSVAMALVASVWLVQRVWG